MLGYLVDSYGRITEFLGDFRGSEIEPNRLLGRPLFEFVQGVELKQILGDLLKRPDREKKVRLHRCDSPERLRLWQVSVDFTGRDTRLWFEQVAQKDRPFQPKLDPFPNPTCYCSWCNAVQGPDGCFTWLNVTDSYRLASLIRRSPERVDHVLCPACLSSLDHPKKPGAFGHLTRAFAGRFDRAVKPPEISRFASPFQSNEAM